MSKCTCGRDLLFPAIFLGVDKLNVPYVQFTCTCGARIKGPYTSMKPYTFSRTTTFPPKPGEWWMSPEGQPKICCPLCKGMSGVSAPQHSIDAAGVVHPSYVCPSGCGFHSYITLARFKEED